MEQWFINNRGIRYAISEGNFHKIHLSDSDAGKDSRKTLKEGHNKEIYFNRNQSCTSNIFDYFNGEKLHVPSDVCPAKFKGELLYWKISENAIDSCCYTKYVCFFKEQKTLEILEKAESSRIAREIQINDIARGSGWRSIRAKLWRTLEYPNSSVMAKIYFYVGNAAVLLSLFSLVASTHPLFQRALTQEEWKEFFTDEEEKYYDHHWGVYDNYSEHNNNSTNNTNESTEHRTLPSDIIVTKVILWYIHIGTALYFTIELFCKFSFFPLPWKYFITFLNVVDIFALIVMYMALITNEVDHKEKYQNTFTDAVHSLQIIRVFRFFRLFRHLTPFQIIVHTLRASLLELLIIFLGLLTAVLLFSSMAYFSRDPTFTDIPQASWWAIVTLTTVGYGDYSPVTLQGKLVGAACAVSGVCLLAILVPVIVNNFLLFYTHSVGIKRKYMHEAMEDASLTKCDSVLSRKK